MPSNPCIRTGANVWLYCENAVIHGDLFLVGNTYILTHERPLEDYLQYNFVGNIHLVMNSFEACGSRCLVTEVSQCGDFTYEGRDLSKLQAHRG